MWLLIDDCRDLNVDVIARNGKAGLHMIALGGWEVIIFDHDLGDLHNINGYELLTHAIEADLLGDAKIQLVTSNPVGREKMISALQADGYTFNCDNPTWTYWSKNDMES